MLPFLKKRQQAGLAVQYRKPDESSEIENREEKDSMEVVAEDLLHAIEAKDHKMLAAAIRSAFAIMESEPHEEGPHTNEE